MSKAPETPPRGASRGGAGSARGRRAGGRDTPDSKASNVDEQKGRTDAPSGADAPTETKHQEVAPSVPPPKALQPEEEEEDDNYKVKIKIESRMERDLTGTYQKERAEGGNVKATRRRKAYIERLAKERAMAPEERKKLLRRRGERLPPRASSRERLPLWCASFCRRHRWRNTPVSIPIARAVH